MTVSKFFEKSFENQTGNFSTYQSKHNGVSLGRAFEPIYFTCYLLLCVELQLRVSKSSYDKQIQLLPTCQI